MYVLGIETSCDETSAAVIKDGTQLLSNIVASQDELHEPYGGVVPELASRCHIEKIESIVDLSLEKASISLEDINGIAVTSGPGLVGSLVVGLSYAKALSYAKKIPFYGVNHLEAHLHAIFLEKKIEYPFIGLLVSGGHTSLYDIRGVGNYTLLGSTVDDACGEAFDKVAKILGLGYPGGRKIDEIAKKGNAKAILFPRPRLKEDDLNFSFSGLKTAVLNYCQKLGKSLSEVERNDIAASFQETVVETLLQKSLKALEKMQYPKLVIAGGVAANSRLRAAFQHMSKEKNIELFIPSLKLCTDNAAMVGALGYHYLVAGQKAPFSLNAYATTSSSQASF
ncbi:MAG: tRNA (adenosine(37)-N6)-threonylcarbamoyltransferase complex transferase subunit TsaD [Deltaproteobacteria bacterium GWA2_38_16]|nr:MAG: tRNA (adenosine(37)-N6)-threonylcarbamoyltransferase complex transferase subunit TsaD [Deltaproteobacteria bacterium GWA2_38_16]OGQ03572.1 MAG: tRNA (adenosine(37)-N6)-threonylcarbamoyltransferase complex transferase subunit TsaD [Deltaproteobacteria bacterium RIFCSPHIGHO2_02_FULL_38_15]OGQ30152.1 MAG: tRNA (adenosine(37)-N6)-threonylcarbamoyltransferase complex transferase subunit TsaD [Deltaproteobacteria bacterium RIFCSPLOWO2_01_FULL_38_9]OGQ64027.1 MAG: tRNA (adenosine(37)-N6)-threon